MLRTLPIATTLSVLAVAVPASAAERHAQPNGSGSACTAAAPCQLETAMDGAAAHDEIVVHAGEHGVDSAGTGNASDLHVHGAAGEARPTVHVGEAACGIFAGPGSRVRNLRVKIDVGFGFGVCVRGASTVESLSVEGTLGTQTGLWFIEPAGAVARGVSVSLPAASSRGVYASDTQGLQLHNLTVQGGHSGLLLTGADGGGTVRVRNSYLHGGTYDAQAICSGDLAITLESNAYDALQSSSAACKVTASSTMPTSGAALSLSGGILRPGATSTLLDAGSTDPVTGTVDVEGDPRVMGGKLDIGADERRVPPSVLSTSVHDLTASSARLSGALSGRGARVFGDFEYGTTTAYGQTAAPPAGRSIIDLNLEFVSATLTGLAPGTTYHFRARAWNEFGQEVHGPDRTFTTAPAPEAPAGDGTTVPDSAPGGAAGPGAPVVPAADRAAPACTLKLVSARRRGRSLLSGRCSEAATLRVTVAGRREATVKVPAGSFRRTLRTGTLRPGRRIVRIVARDGAGNAAAAIRLALRRRR